MLSYFERINNVLNLHVSQKNFYREGQTKLIIRCQINFKIKHILQRKAEPMSGKYLRIYIEKFGQQRITKDSERFENQLTESANFSWEQWNLIIEIKHKSRTCTKTHLETFQ